MWLVFALGVVSLIAADVDRNCTIDRNNLPGFPSSWFGDVGWRCSNVHPVNKIRRCLPLLFLCDTGDNCGDGEDEGEVCGGFGEDRTCTDPFTGEASRWRCTTGSKKCIEELKLCDKVDDCDGGEDESFCNFPDLHPGCHVSGCHTCAADAKILTDSEYWNSTEEHCRKCKSRRWRRCNDGTCYNNILRCDNNNNCLDGSDELNCPWYTRLSATNTLAACFGVVLSFLMIFILMRKVKLIDTRIEYDESPAEMAIVSVDKFVTKMKISTEMDDELKEIYREIHQASQISQLISAVKIFFTGLKTNHEITVLVFQLEESIHGGRRQALLCLRVYAGSNADVERLLSYEGDPGILKKLKKKATQATDALLGQFCMQPLATYFPNIKKWSYSFTKMIVASFKVSLFLWDFTKDLILWVLLYGKADELDASEKGFLWLYFSLIFCAQSVLGFYITSEYKEILSLPNHMKTYKKALVLITMFLLTPCLPSLVIFKATVYSSDMAAIMANARNNPFSQPSKVLQEINAIKQKQRIHSQIYAYARQDWNNAKFLFISTWSIIINKSG